MKDKTLYKMSKKMKTLRNLAVGLTHYDWYAYHHMIDSSPKKFECSYAKVLKRNGDKEKDELLKDFKQIITLIKKIKEGMNEQEDEKEGTH